VKTRKEGHKGKKNGGNIYYRNEAVNDVFFKNRSMSKTTYIFV
jgi:hypothetical protein